MALILKCKLQSINIHTLHILASGRYNGIDWTLISGLCNISLSNASREFSLI